MYLILFTNYAQDKYTVLQQEWMLSETPVREDIYFDEVVCLSYETNRTQRLLEQLKFLGYDDSLVRSIARSIIPVCVLV